MNIAVLASGIGTNLQAIMDAAKIGYIKAELSLVISDNEQAYALQRARKASIVAVHLDPKSFKSKEDFDKEIIRRLKEHDVELVALAGYMRLLTSQFIKEFKDRIMNVHPALLPSFKGANGLKSALEYGVKITGPTVHFVTDDVDSGPIIAQAAVEISDEDTEESLREKVQTEEHNIYPTAIKDFVEGSLKITGRKVLHIKKEKRNEDKD